MTDPTPRFVLDSSVALGWSLADEPWYPQSREVLRDIADGRLEPVTAPNFRFEVRHGLVRAVRRRRLAWSGFQPRLVAIDGLEMVVPLAQLADGDLAILCRAYAVSWGDAHHALLARLLGLPLITADRRLVAALAESDVWVEFIGDRPADPGPIAARPRLSDLRRAGRTGSGCRRGPRSRRRQAPIRTRRPRR